MSVFGLATGDFDSFEGSCSMAQIVFHRCAAIGCGSLKLPPMYLCLCFRPIHSEFVGCRVPQCRMFSFFILMIFRRLLDRHIPSSIENVYH